MRYITVPYTLSLFNDLTQNKLDLYKIWKSQEITQTLRDVLYKMMVKVEDFIKLTAPGGLYGEWAKKEDCWLLVKNNNFQFDLSSIENEFLNKNRKSNRVIVSNDEIALEQINEEIEKIRAVPFTIWKKIDSWAIGSKDLSPNQINIIDSIAYRVRTKTKLLENERLIGIKIIDIVIDKAPELLFDIDDIVESEKEKLNDDPEIDYELIKGTSKNYLSIKAICKLCLN